MALKNITSEDISELYAILASVRTPQECRELLDDLCTVKEIEQMAQRIKAAKMLMEGKTYNQVVAETEISSATLSRVSRCVQGGTGYSKLLKNSTLLPKKRGRPRKNPL